MTNYSEFGQAGIWCWIKSGKDDKYIYYQIAYYILTWIIVLLNTLFVILLIWNLRQLNCNDEIITRYVNKLKLYPIIQIISLIPATINRIISLSSENKHFFCLMVFQVIFDSLTGLIFSIVYGFNPNVRKLIHDYFTGIFSKKKELKENENNNLNDSDSLEPDHPNRFRSDSKIFDDNVVTSQAEY